MKGQPEAPSTVLCTLVVAVIIQTLASVSTAKGLNVTVTLVHTQAHQGRGVVLKCAIRNMDRLHQKLYWRHTTNLTDVFQLVSSGLVLLGQYNNARFDVKEIRAAVIPNVDYYLTISDFMPGDTGDYSCLVVNITNGLTLRTETATVSIHDPPKSPSCSPEGTVNVTEGSLLSMSCSSETVASPDNMTLTWIPPTNTVTSWGGPQDADWQVVHGNRSLVAKQLNLVVDSKFNYSKFVCGTDEDDFVTCIIGLITVVPVPPGLMDISVNIRQPEFPLRDGVVSGFTCDIVFTPPVDSAKDYIQRHWKTSSEVDYNRIFKSSNPTQRTILINITAQDSGGVLECTVTFRDKVYRGNITLHVAHNASIPETTIAYPTAATKSVSTRTLPPMSNLPWYTELSSIAIICGAAVVLLLLTLLIVCLTHHRRRKLNRNRVQEVPLGSEQDSGYSPTYLNSSRPLTVFSENIYNEASDPTTETTAAFGENIYHETVDPSLPVSRLGGNINHETVDSTDPISADGENVYHEAAEVVVLPLNESREDFPSSQSEQMPFECGSPVPQLEVYAETVENILYVPGPQDVILEDGYSTVVETHLR